MSNENPVEFFEKKKRQAAKDEERLAVALAKHYDCGLYFNQGNLEEFDYKLINYREDRISKIEQKNSRYRDVCVELLVHQKSKSIKGWLYTTKSDFLVWVNEVEETFYIINMKSLRDYIAVLHSEQKLSIIDYSKNGKWKYPSSPTSLTILKIEDLINHLGRDICVKSFKEIDYEKN